MRREKPDSRFVILIAVLVMNSAMPAQSAGMICTMQRGRIVAPTYADMARVLEIMQPSNRGVEGAFTLQSLLKQGRVTQLPPGTEVEVEGQPLANGAVRIHLVGTSDAFWTGTAYLNCPR